MVGTKQAVGVSFATHCPENETMAAMQDLNDLYYFAQVVEHGDDKVAVANRAYDRVGHVEMCVARVTPINEQRMAEMRSPHAAG